MTLSRALKTSSVTLLSIVFVISTSLSFPLLNNQQFTRLQTRDDYVNYIIITDTQLLDDTSASYQPIFQQYLLKISNKPNVKIYENDCNDKHIPECDNKERNPLLILVNRTPVKFKPSGSQQPVKVKDIIQWIETRINKQVHKIESKQELEHLIAQNQNNLFCLCYNKKKPLQRTYFQALVKNYPYLEFCFISTPTLTEELGFIPGNFTFYKTSINDRQDLQYQNRYQMWEGQLKTKMLPSMQRAGAVTRQRFSKQSKNKHVFAVACQFTYQCDKIFAVLAQRKRQILQIYPQIDFRLSLGESDTAFYLYFHLQVQKSKFPALLHIHITNQNQNGQVEGGGKVTRHVRYIESLDLQIIKSFIQDVNSNKIEAQYLSAQKPKKNGFTGKGSQKLIQKLTAETIEQTIASRDKPYILLVSILNLGCSECDQFYAQFKKMASLIGTEQITFGFIDLQYNEITLKDLENIPQVLLYRLGENVPIIMQNRHRFDSLLEFIEKNLKLQNQAVFQLQL